jgi:hypothetical protein
MRVNPTPTLATAVLVCLFSACASSQGGTSGGMTPPPTAVGSPAAEAVFVVASQHPDPVSLYATNGALRVRLGTLTAWRTLHVQVPPLMVGRGRVVRLVARPIGARRDVATEAFAVERGDQVFWTLTRRLESSPATLHVDLARGR